MSNLVKVASDNLAEAKSRQAQYANQGCREEELNFGDKVMISTANIQLASQTQRPTRKLQHKFTGPYEIINKVGPIILFREATKGKSVASVVTMTQCFFGFGSHKTGVVVSLSIGFWVICCRHCKTRDGHDLGS
ncbi:uncharacterized protein VTP21DRAFT_1126 [Calcarisporiella thermophila]|uniref:uncharacterized protein n=1 Tax=Calcarisporiella thermophila TaxID=911321 RepID=UPI003743663A